MSGISGGSYFTSVASIVYSDVIKGAGLFIGGPFGSVTTDAFKGTLTAEEVASNSYALAVEYQEAGYIDQLSNLRDEPVFVYSGSQDDVVLP